MESAATSLTASKVILPWKSFKAYVQLFDISAGDLSIEIPIRSQSAKLLVESGTSAGESTRAPLLMHGLIKVATDGRIALRRGIPYGREYLSREPDPASIIVSPQARSAAGAAWIRTYGRCAYCGKPLMFFSQLALGNTVDGNGGMRLFGCKRCHAMRGSRSLENFRFLVEMEQFQRRHGVRFDRQQVEYLKKIGVELDIPHHAFWFERYNPGADQIR